MMLFGLFLKEPFIYQTSAHVYIIPGGDAGGKVDS